MIESVRVPAHLPHKPCCRKRHLRTKRDTDDRDQPREAARVDFECDMHEFVTVWKGDGKGRDQRYIYTL